MPLSRNDARILADEIVGGIAWATIGTQEVILITPSDLVARIADGIHAARLHDEADLEAQVDAAYERGLNDGEGER
jgi:hypothetical protein